MSNSQGWVSLKPLAQNSIQLSYIGAQYLDHLSTTYLHAPQQEARSKAKQRQNLILSTPIWDIDISSDRSTCCTNTYCSDSNLACILLNLPFFLATLQYISSLAPFYTVFLYFLKTSPIIHFQLHKKASNDRMQNLQPTGLSNVYHISNLVSLYFIWACGVSVKPG